MRRFHQGILIIATLALSWLLMQAAHELGHVAAAWATDATVTKLVLHPLSISRTDVEPNPRPLIVAWSGPVVGVILPLALWGGAAAARLPVTFLFRFFAGFCLLSNGLYLGLGSFNAVEDAGDILRHGSPAWTLWLFGLATAPAGLAVWNGLGTAFGQGTGSTDVSSKLAFGCVSVLVAIVVLELIFSGR